MSSRSEESSLAEQLSDNRLLNVEICDDVCVIRFIEPLLRDSERQRGVKRAFSRLARKYSRFVIDLSVVEYCSSLVLGTLVLLQTTADEKGGSAHVCGIRGQVRELFAVTAVETLFAYFDSEAAAIDAFRDA